MIGRAKIVAWIGVIIALAAAGGTFRFFSAQAQEAPASLTAAVRSACAIDLLWTAAPGAGNSYELRFTTEPSFFSGGTLLATTAETSYAHAPLRPSTEYRYRVRTVNGGNSSAWTDATPAPAATHALPAAPAVPGGFTATGVNDTDASASTNDGKQIDLSWTSADLSAYGGFSIERAAGDRTNEWTPLGIFAPDLRSLRDGGGLAPLLDNTKAYHYRISAFESAEDCVVSDRQFSASSTILVVPSTPRNLKTVYQYNPNAAVNKIELSWTPGAGQDSVEIYRKPGLNGEQDFARIETLPQANADHWSDNKVLPNQSYWYRVRGVASASGVVGYSAYSNDARAAVANAPQNLAASLKSVGTDTVTVGLSWDNTFPEQNYQVERAEGTGAFARVGVKAGPASSVAEVFFEDAPARGKEYRYRVRADFGGRQSEYSDEVPLNANLTPVKGWAWSGNGLGWIRLSHDSPNSSWGPATTPTESIPYGVYLGSDGVLAGYAWSPYAGWLSFNKSHLAGCPAGTCEAKVGAIDPNQRFRNVNGWAKFVSDGNGNGIGELVSLSSKGGEPRYGLVYATTTDGAGELRGITWGGGTVGWLSFGGPILKNVTPRPDGTSVEVEWENPIAYKGIQIRSVTKKPGINLNDKKESDLRLDVTQGNLVTRGDHKTAIIKDLKPDTEYAFFVKGTPE